MSKVAWVPVYLDHAATTPMIPEAVEAYLRVEGQVGNASSIHGAGQRQRKNLEDARAQIAESLGADPLEVIFTSGGTEAINLALKGLFWERTGRGFSRDVVVPLGEHHATIDTVEWLERHESARLRWIGLDGEGFIDVGGFGAALGLDSDNGGEGRQATAPTRGRSSGQVGLSRPASSSGLSGSDPAQIPALATALWANNEVGTIEPITELAGLTRMAGVPLHLDAVAAFGHLPIDFHNVGCTALSVSAHKIGGPVGIGALLLAREAIVEPLVHGGGQQRGLRSGTQDVAAAAAFAAATEVAVREMANRSARLSALQQRLIAGVHLAVPSACLSGPVGQSRLASNVHFTFPGAQGDSLLLLLDAAGISVSTGSACQAGTPEPSHVVLAMGLGQEAASSALRLTLGPDTTEADIDSFLAVLPNAYRHASMA